MENTVLLFGGNSDERLVSVASAQNLSKRFNFSERWFINPDGSIAKVTQEELIAHQRAFEIQFKSKEPNFARSIAEAIPALKGKAVFIGMHGTEGEDGTMQSLFEKNGIAFTGSGSKSSRMCFNKIEAKKVASAAGVPVAKQISFGKESAEKIQTLLTNFFNEHKMIVVKPVESGSSFGLHILLEANAIPAAAKAIAAAPYDLFMAEQFLKGRELTVGVMDRASGLFPLPPSEVLLQQGRAFDYQGKYLGNGVKEVTPADLNEKEKAAAQKLAMDAHKALGCAGYSRTDMILTPAGPVFLETNTLPGLSGASFVPQQLEACEIPIAAFVEEQLEFAKNRSR